jgi:hypothetical protein
MATIEKTTTQSSIQPRPPFLATSENPRSPGPAPTSEGLSSQFSYDAKGLSGITKPRRATSVHKSLVSRDEVEVALKIVGNELKRNKPNLDLIQEKMDSAHEALSGRVKDYKDGGDLLFKLGNEGHPLKGQLQNYAKLSSQCEKKFGGGFISREPFHYETPRNEQEIYLVMRGGDVVIRTPGSDTILR